MSVMSKKSKLGSSRREIALRGVEDGVLEFTGGEYRLILESSSVNFELKSEEEQDAIIDTYRQFLNSLSFPIQILVRVREVSIDKYLSGIRAKATAEEDAFIKDQLDKYVAFVQSYMTQNKVLTRRFFFVLSSQAKRGDKDLTLERLHLNADIVTKGLARLGVVTSKLDSLSALDLFHGFYKDESASGLTLTEQALAQLQGETI